MQPAITNDRLSEMIRTSPFQRLLNLTVKDTDTVTQTLELVMPFNPDLARLDGEHQFHGGVIASLIDIAGDCVLVWALGFTVPTINFRTDYLRPAHNTSLTAKATIRRIGKSIGVVDIEVADEEDRVVAIGRGSYGTSKG